MHILPRLGIVRRQEFIIGKCTQKRVLHLGAIDDSAGALCGLHKKLMTVAENIVGIDIDREGIELAKLQNIHNIYYGDLEQLDKVDIPAQIDMIAASQIIEHLANPGQFLAGIKRFFGPNTEMVIDTPNAFSLHRFAYALARREYVHPDHTCYYSYITLKYLLESNGFVIREELAYVLDEIKFSRISQALGKINFQFAHGLIFVVGI